jgi:hypothetical protein
MPASALAIIAIAMAVLALPPTRRLYLAGLRGWPLGAYFLLVVGLGVLVAELRVAARFLVPILVIAYLAPFVTARAGIDRLLGRGPGPGAGTPRDPARPMKNVTPPDDDPSREEPPRTGGAA